MDTSKRSKNILQELCHENNWELPKYDTKFVGGEPHRPKFESTVSVQGKIYGGCEKTNKKHAELDAAEVALKHLKISPPNYLSREEESSNKEEISDNEEIVYLPPPN